MKTKVMRMGYRESKNLFSRPMSIDAKKIDNLDFVRIVSRDMNGDLFSPSGELFGARKSDPRTD
jgi:hypothetical protein